MNFNELNLSIEMKSCLKKLGFTMPTPIQAEAIPLLLEGADLLAEAPTGTGKTLAYAIPSIEKLKDNDFRVQTLVICPTRELAIQSVSEINKVICTRDCPKAVAIYGGQDIQRQIRALKAKPRIIVGTPGRLIDHIDRHTIKLDHLANLVLDECDVMLDMGFISSINEILENIKSDHQTMLFSATISKEIKKLSEQYLNPNFQFVKVPDEFANQKLIDQYYLKVQEDSKKDWLIGLLNSITYEKCFIFCRTKRKVSQIAKFLNMSPHQATAIHGDLSQRQRDTAMNAFRHNEIKILVATDIAARGIDVSDADVVINYDVPEQDEFYLHRIGRTGRARKRGASYTFINKKQKGLLAVYEKMSEDVIKEFQLKLDKEMIVMASKKYLESLKSELNNNNKDYEGIINDTLKAWNQDGNEAVSAVQLAALLLKNAIEITDKRESTRDEESIPNRRTEKKAARVTKAGYQRFFINIGEKDGTSEIKLKKFITKYAPEIKEKDFSDVYLKSTFSFFELPDKFVDSIMSNINNIKYGAREVHVELSAGKCDNNGEKLFAKSGRVYKKDKVEEDDGAVKSRFKKVSHSENKKPRRDYRR